jgi:hypothetical protein
LITAGWTARRNRQSDIAAFLARPVDFLLLDGLLALREVGLAFLLALVLVVSDRLLALRPLLLRLRFHLLLPLQTLLQQLRIVLKLS